ncbi:MAG: hypothetical protein ACM3ZE_08925, partial [Myxococcales bacterium]
LYVYLGMFSAQTRPLGLSAITLAFSIPILAMVGALASACFVKVYAVVFLGEPRAAHAETAKEAPLPMRIPQYVLAAACVVIGLFPQLPIRVLLPASSYLSGSTGRAKLAAVVAPLAPSLSTLSAVSGVLVGLAVVLLLAFRYTRRSRQPRNLTWDCGYAAPSVRMQYSASSIADDLVSMFRSLLRPTVKTPNIAGTYPRPSTFESHVPEVVLDLLVLPCLRGIVRVAELLRFIQRGTVHLYLLYVLLTLIVMLAVWR